MNEIKIRHENAAHFLCIGRNYLPTTSHTRIFTFVCLETHYSVCRMKRKIVGKFLGKKILPAPFFLAGNSQRSRENISKIA